MHFFSTLVLFEFTHFFFKKYIFQEEKAKKIETGGESPIKAPFDKGTLLPLWGNKQNDLFNDDAKTYKKDSSRISNEFKSKKYMIENIDPEM